MPRPRILRKTAERTQERCAFECDRPVMINQEIAAIQDSGRGWGHEDCLYRWLAAGGDEATYVTSLYAVYRVDFTEPIEVGGDSTIGTLRLRVNRNLRGTPVRFKILHTLHLRGGMTLLYAHVVAENVNASGLISQVARYLAEFFGESIVKVVGHELDRTTERKEES